MYGPWTCQVLPQLPIRYHARMSADISFLPMYWSSYCIVPPSRWGGKVESFSCSLPSPTNCEVGLDSDSRADSSLVSHDRRCEGGANLLGQPRSELTVLHPERTAILPVTAA